MKIKYRKKIYTWFLIFQFLAVQCYELGPAIWDALRLGWWDLRLDLRLDPSRLETYLRLDTRDLQTSLLFRIGKNMHSWFSGSDKISHGKVRTLDRWGGRLCDLSTEYSITNNCTKNYWIPTTNVKIGWLGSPVVSVLDSGAEGPGFKSQSRRCRVTVLGKLFTPIVPLFTKQQNW